VRLARKVVPVPRDDGDDFGLLIEQGFEGRPCGRPQGQALVELDEVAAMVRQNLDELARIARA
jgi:hypothetical protein